MTENDKINNTIEENESNDGVKGQNKQVICMMHPVALVI